MQDIEKDIKKLIKKLINEGKRGIREVIKFFNKYPAVLFLLIVFGIFLAVLGSLEIDPVNVLFAAVVVVVFCGFAIIIGQKLKGKDLRLAFGLIIAFIEFATLVFWFFVVG